MRGRRGYTRRPPVGYGFGQHRDQRIPQVLDLRARSGMGLGAMRNNAGVLVRATAARGSKDVTRDGYSPQKFVKQPGVKQAVNTPPLTPRNKRSGRTFAQKMDGSA